MTQIKLPSHVLDFHCGMCGQCCSDKWSIAVDAASYHKLQQKLAALGRQDELQDKFLFPDRKPRIQFLANGKCPYLNQDNLCRIQLELGACYLLDICKVFPRRIFASPEALEFSLALTCHAAINTLQHQPIQILETNYPIQSKENISFSFIEPNYITPYFPAKYIAAELSYHELEKSFIEILQDHRYSINRRLVLLGQELLLLLAGKKMCEISRLPLETAPDLPRHLKHLYFLSNVFRKRFTSINMSQHLQKILLSLAPEESGIPLTKLSPPSPLDYQKMLSDYYTPAGSEISLVLENYLVNFLLNKTFYLQPLHLAYYRMTFTYAAVIAFSIGHCLIKKQPLNSPIVLQAIYDVENIFFNSCFYPRAANYQAGQTPLQIIDNGMALANI
ncbi:MAG: flagellin lysine-N-methylase [Pelosinus sp.]|nr:flagellin lysine-N-methylase [Pelosinus sp.]